MIWGIKNDKRIKAKPKESSNCPICKGELIPKCGVVKSWHWAHKKLGECDTWSEGETEWHIKWKNEFPEELQEVIVENHRADIKLENDLVIEIQNSSISANDICDREMFYDKMVWLLNGKSLGKGFEIRDKNSYFTFIWKNPPVSWFYSNKEIYIDLKYKLEEIKEMYKDCMERLGIVFEKLENLVGDPNKFDFEPYKYIYASSSEREKEIYESEKLWGELSKESRELNKVKELFISKVGFEERTIFYIKKLYKKIPCAGWGYLISKEDFICKMEEKYEK